MSIIFGITTLVSFIGFIFFTIKFFSLLKWHNYGEGRSKALAEFGRIRREEPDSPKAKFSEAEFVNEYVKQRPGILGSILLVAACIFIGVISFIATIFLSLGG